MQLHQSIKGQPKLSKPQESFQTSVQSSHLHNSRSSFDDSVNQIIYGQRKLSIQNKAKLQSKISSEKRHTAESYTEKN